jgi:hypothetical protein
MNAEQSATPTIRADIALCPTVLRIAINRAAFTIPRAIFDLRFGTPYEYPCELDMTMLIGFRDFERNSRHGFWKA